MKDPEDEAFDELERKLGRKEVKAAMVRLDSELDTYRNEVIEEVAVALEKFKVPFGNDTVASFVMYVRSMKKGAE